MNRIELLFLGNSASAVKAAKETEAAVAGVGRETTKTGKAGVVAGVGLLGLGIGLAESVKAAIAGQASQAALATALRDTHQSLTEVGGPLGDAEKASRKLGFADDDTRTSLAKLEIATGNTKKSVTDLTLAEDIARLKRVDLDTATKMLTGTLAGNARAARQLGILISPVTSHMDALKEKYKQLGQAIPPAEAAQAKLLDKQATGVKTLQAVTDKVHGQAQAFADTAAGGMAQFHAQTQHLEEELGGGLVPALAGVASVLASVFGFLGEHATATKILVGTLALLATTVIAVSAAEKVWAALTAVAEAAQWALNAALDANPIGLVVIAIAALVAAFVLAYTHSETFRDIVNGVFATVKGVVEGFVGFFTTTLPNAFNTVKSWVSANWPIIATIISGPFAPLVALATNAFGIRDKLEAAMTAIKTFVGARIDDVVGFFSALPGRALAAVAGIGNTLNAGLQNMKSFASGVVSDVVGFFTGLPGKILTAATSVGTSFVSGLTSGLSALGGALRKAIVEPIDAVLSAWNSIGFDVNLPSVHVPHVGDVGGGHLSFHVPQIPLLAAGGIVTSPTLAMIGEAGPEAVIPLDRMGAGTTVNVIFQNGFLVGNKRQIGEAIADSVQAALERRGPGLQFGV